MILREDTIVALATAPGRAAIAVVRLSGSQARVYLERVASHPSATVATAHLTSLIDPRDGTPIDHAVTTWYQSPASYTGEDLVEFSCHGSPTVITALVDALVWLGARPADAGEFTQRAFLHGKLDLLQVEAIGQVIDAPTQAARRIALQQLRGELSRHLVQLRGDLLDVEALLAYDIDFPEEDDGPVSRTRVSAAATRVITRIENMRATFPVGDSLVAGARVVIAGAPNVGKSSLFNALLGEHRAIVTDLPGTTRDSLEASLDLGPWTLRLVDTAGLRETADAVERLGVEVSLTQVARAHIVLACGETCAGIDETAKALHGLHQAVVVGVLTKADEATDHARTGEVAVSAHTRYGIPELLARLAQVLEQQTPQALTGAPIVINARHRRGLDTAADQLREFRALWESEDVPAPVAATHIRAACHALDELLGSVEVSDILDRVFASFCVGK